MLASNGYPGMMAPAMQSAAAGIGPYCGPGSNGSHAHQYNSPMAAAFWQARHHMGQPNGGSPGAAASSGAAAGVNGMAQVGSHHPALGGHQTSVSAAASGHHHGDAKMAEKIVSELQVHKPKICYL